MARPKRYDYTHIEEHIPKKGAYVADIMESYGVHVNPTTRHNIWDSIYYRLNRLVDEGVLTKEKTIQGTLFKRNS